MVNVQQQVNRDATTKIPTSSYRALHKAVLDACDQLDGVRDGVLEDPRRCSLILPSWRARARTVPSA